MNDVRATIMTEYLRSFFGMRGAYMNFVWHFFILLISSTLGAITHTINAMSSSTWHVVALLFLSHLIFIMLPIRHNALDGRGGAEVQSPPMSGLIQDNYTGGTEFVGYGHCVAYSCFAFFIYSFSGYDNLQFSFAKTQHLPT